jgi:DNA-directed RNA polymerase specialized sigma24 family protein
VSIHAGVNESDLESVRAILAGSEAAAVDLREKHHGKLVGILCARGATKTEAEDLVADLWSDCFGSSQRPSPILAKYQGRCALESWMVTIATNRLIGLKRRQRFRAELPQPNQNRLTDPFDSLPGVIETRAEGLLLDLLSRCVINAFSEADPEILLMLRLVHIYGVTQREIGRMWRWHESKVSRSLDQAGKTIKKRVLAEIRKTDPWLTLTWEDFSDLCRYSPPMFDSASKLNDWRQLEVQPTIGLHPGGGHRDKV